MIKVLVTGGSGFLATNIIIALLGNGYSVVALVRNKQKFLLPASANLEVIEGDLTDLQSLENSIRVCEYIIHSAAEIRQDLKNYHDYQKINVTGTQNVFEIASRYKIKKVVYVSTANVFGYGTSDNPGNETCSTRQPFSNSLYVKSKIEAQRIAFSYSNRIEVIVVNPTFLLGPYDQRPGSGKIITAAYNKRFIFYPTGGKNFIHVSDVSAGIVNALTKGVNKESYLLAGANISYSEIFKKISVHSVKKPIFIPLPGAFLLALGFFGNVLRYFGLNTNLTLTNMKILCVKSYYTGKKAENELGLILRPIEFAIEEAINWFKRTNKI